MTSSFRKNNSLEQIPCRYGHKGTHIYIDRYEISNLVNIIKNIKVDLFYFNDDEMVSDTWYRNGTKRRFILKYVSAL